jgi:hypothetical protein
MNHLRRIPGLEFPVRKGKESGTGAVHDQSRGTHPCLRLMLWGRTFVSRQKYKTNVASHRALKPDNTLKGYILILVPRRGIHEYKWPLNYSGQPALPSFFDAP